MGKKIFAVIFWRIRYKEIKKSMGKRAIENIV